MRVAALPLMLAGILSCVPALAEVHEVKMLNRGAAGSMVYEPDYLRIAPGDTVKFIATQSGHNAASVPGLLPAGAQAFKGKINQEIEQTFNVPGLYGIQCIPHLAMGMVMLIQVGAPAAEAPEVPAALPRRAVDRFNTLLQREAAK
ncbi:pseudoazurin [Pseudomonas sp. MAFF212428]|uniref:Pseudoazurin n=1 Tax=Pseudomonas brassicae TaxID=2708063 RepID=A0A6B3NPU1_9PSED|nr:pseudoazurin [Pseudomonas brassicae]NER61425.1 pseudoazurin [Pseudomonas brassicae]NER65392.1 pseudoazurin [Pseudomonas brassicae]